MATITEIRPQVKDKGRCSLYLDGKFYCGLPLEVAVKHHLKVGGQVEPEELDEMQLENERHMALDRALTYISASMKTEKQISDYLKGKGYVPAVIEFVLEKMREYRFVDDEEYAKLYLRSAGKQKGKRLLALELKRKGASEAAVERALAEHEGEDEAARAVLARYMRGREWTKETLYKAFRYLLSKGFDYDTAKGALGELDED